MRPSNGPKTCKLHGFQNPFFLGGNQMQFHISLNINGLNGKLNSKQVALLACFPSISIVLARSKVEGNLIDIESPGSESQGIMMNQ